MAAAADWGADDEWELVNDDGFVFKRRKRPRLDLDSAAAPPSPPDPALEEKTSREWKKRNLLNCKKRYQRELAQWEHLTNTLSNMQQISATLQQQRLQGLNTTSSVPPAQSSNSSRRKLVDELLSQAEAQEAIIQDASNLCDIVEAICSRKEEISKQSFFELPIWASSPHELIKSLCDD